MEKINKFFRKIINNNKILAVVCAVAAVIIWLIFAISFSPETTTTITGVPVKIDYESIRENLGLTPFGQTDFTVDVTVTGRRLVIESDDFRDSITVTASTGSVTGAGTYSLRLDTAAGQGNDSVIINSVSESNITVYFDYEASEEFTVEVEIAGEDSFVPDGYVAGEAYASTKKVTVTGPESEVNKITAITAKTKVEDNLTETKVITVDLTAQSNSNLNTAYVRFFPSNSTKEISAVDVTVPVFKRITLETSAGFTGKPTSYSESDAFSYSVAPAKVALGIPESRAEGMTAFVVKKIDFSELHPGTNTFTVDASEVENNSCIILDGTQKFTVTVTLSNAVTSVLDAPATAQSINVPEGVTVESAKLNFDKVTIAGVYENVSEITLDETNFGIDLSGVTPDEQGEITVPVVFSDDYCWAVGEYTATVVISQ